MKKQSLITRTKDTCWGAYRIRGTRIPVYMLQTYGNPTVKALKEQYPYLSSAQIKAALNFRRKKKI